MSPNNKNYAKLVGSKKVRTNFQRFRRSILSKSMRMWLGKELLKLNKLRQKKGEFDHGSKNYSSYWQMLRGKANLGTSKSKVRLSSKRGRKLSGSLIYKSFMNLSDYVNGIGGGIIRIRNMPTFWDKITKRRRKINLQKVYKYLADKYGYNFIYITNKDERYVDSLWRKKILERKIKFLG